MLAWLALFLPSLAAYSAGAVLSDRSRLSERQDGPGPTVVDTAAVAALWLGGVASRLAGLHEWIAVALLVGLAALAGLVLGLLQRRPDERTIQLL